VALALLSSIFWGLERAWADSVMKNILVGLQPVGSAFDLANGYTYVTNAD
jgi:hypothetical protein